MQILTKPSIEAGFHKYRTSTSQGRVRISETVNKSLTESCCKAVVSRAKPENDHILSEIIYWAVFTGLHEVFPAFKENSRENVKKYAKI